MKRLECKAFEEIMAAETMAPADSVRSDLQSHLSDLQAHLSGCAECREEYEWLRAAGADFEELGRDYDSWRMQEAGEIDVLRGVLAGIHKPSVVTTHSPVVTVTFQPKQRGVIWKVATAALAASLIIGLAWVAGYYRGQSRHDGGATTVAGKLPIHLDSGVTTSPTSASLKSTEVASRMNREIQDNRRKLSAAGPLVQEAMRAAKDAAKDAASTDNAKNATLNEILALCRERTGDAHAKLAQLASLTEARAREIVRSPNTSLAAKIGAARSLPPDEAVAVLKDAVKAYPDEPALLYELGKAMAAQGGKESDAAAAFAAAANMDAENAMSHYRLASNLFKQGDAAGATAALQRATSMARADEYSLASEAYRVQALNASGVDLQTAQLLTAVTEGMGQYDDIVNLGAQLLGYGQEFEKQGNTDLAQQIYEAVNTLGAQLFNSSPVTSEQLAGLDVEQAAIQLLSEIMASTGVEESLQALNSQATSLINSVNSLGNMLNSLSGLFSGQLSSAQLQQLVTQILTSGDASVAQLLSGRPQ